MFEYLSTGPVVDLTTISASNFSLSSLSNNRLLSIWSTFVDGVGTTFWAQILDTNGQPLSAAISVTGPSLYFAPTPTVTELSDGRLVIAWQQGDFSSTSVHAQIYSSSGTPLGAEFTLPGSGNQFSPRITATSDGGFVVGWNTTSLSPGGNLLVQRFDATGAATGGSVQINTAVSSNQTISDLDAMPGGGFIATWSVNGDVHARVVDASGALLGTEITVNTATAGTQGAAQIEVLSSGRFVIVWESSDPARDGSGTSVLAQLFEADGTPVGSEILVNTVTAGNQGNPSVAALADGTFVVSWANETSASSGANYGPSSIRAQVFDASGVRQGSEIVVQSNTASVEVRPNVVALDNGGFSVGWIESSGIGVALTTRSELRTFAPVSVQAIAPGASSLSLDENRTIVGTLALTDGNGQALSYAITGGADAARFTIDNATGALLFVSAPNFEAPTDTGADNVYDLVVTVSGSQGSSNQAIAVSVANINEAPVITSNGSGTTASVTRSENGTSVTTVQAGDQDGNAITYSIVGGADAARFTINASTGALSFVSAPNREAPTDVGGDNVYDVIVQASDGTLSDTQAIAVTVTNVNEAPVISSNGGGTTATIALTENTLGVTTAAATDPEGTAITYFIFGGADAARFTINAATGALQFISGPNFEAPTDADGNNSYLVTIGATDGSLTDYQDLTVTVSNVNEAPVITSSGGGDTASIAVNEASSLSVVVVAATDPEGTARTYSIVGGADAARFTINASTGLLRFVSTPNFEAPTDADGNNVYDVIVRASDGTLFDTQTLSVTVLNVNESPIISTNGGGASASITLSENIVNVTTVAATDPDGTAITYSISGGLDAALFTIDAQTGLLRFINAPNFESPTDNGANNVYNVNVRATDAGGVWTTQTIAVTVTNANEAPLFTSSASLSASENSTAAGTVTASDPEGSARTYSIVGGADAALFTIDPVTGALSFISAPNHETPGDADGDNAYQVTVQASDGTLATSQAVTVTVGNVNEGPAITSSSSLGAAENGTAVATLSGSDPEGTALTWSILGGADAALFAIDAATGALSFVSTPDHEVPGDADGDNVYELTVQASDGTLSATQTVTVTVGNVNEGPAITSSSSLGASENGTAVATLTGSDPEATALTWSIAGGADAALFTIDAVTGALSFVSAPNYEAPTDAGADNVYDVIVSASDGLLAATQAIAVAVSNGNEGQLVAPGQGFAASENSTAAGTFTASDLDGDALTYAISGGADAARFTINSITGAVSFVTAPDFEAPSDSNGDNVYDLVITASDGTIATQGSYSVTVGNVNEAPVITGSTSLTASEGSTAVATLSASDPENNTPTWSISGGVDAARFTINAATGALSFVTTPDFEAPSDSDGDNQYLVQVTVSDGSLTASQLFTINLGNVNEAPLITSNGGGASAAIAVSENSATVTTVTSTDPEGTARTYSIVGGADAARFSINAATGALSFISPPNYEAPTDAGGNNVYDVIVQASDGFLTDTQALAITVGNVNEAPVITSNGGGDTASVTINENTSAVLTVTSTDPEGTARTYSIVGGNDAARFTINPTTGALSFIAAPNWELPTDSNADNIYNVIVAASDGSLTDTQALAVTVGNVVDGSTINGTNSANTLTGTTAEDTINGLGGNDTITGGLGADVLTGGNGADRFVYSSINDSSLSAPDRITDFSLSQNDRISLSGIDANTGLTGDQAFSWIGTGNFTNVAGQLRYYQQNGHTYVTGDVNGDGVGDFLIQIDPAVTLSASYFIL